MPEKIEAKTELQTVDQPQPTSNVLTLYDRFTDPIEAIDKIGDWFFASDMFGCKKPAQGKVLAMACLVKHLDPFVLMQQNMIVDGKLTKRYEVMLAELRKAGGDFEWVEDGEAGVQATIKIVWRGRESTYTYTIDMARQAGLLKKDSGWEKRPGNMLRSKAVRNGLTMHVPELVAGFLTPEDAEEIAASDAKPVIVDSPALDQLREAVPVKPAEAEAAGEPPKKKRGRPRKAKSESDPSAASEAQPTSTPIDNVVSANQLLTLKSQCELLKIDDKRFDEGCRKSFACAPGDMSVDQANELIAKFEASIKKK